PRVISSSRVTGPPPSLSPTSGGAVGKCGAISHGRHPGCEADYPSAAWWVGFYAPPARTASTAAVPGRAPSTSTGQTFHEPACTKSGGCTLRLVEAAEKPVRGTGPAPTTAGRATRQGDTREELTVKPPDPDHPREQRPRPGTPAPPGGGWG